MLHHQLLLAIRHLLRHKIYSAINIFGLAVGLGASAMIFSWVRYEYSFDQHHEKADRIYRVIPGSAERRWPLHFQIWHRRPPGPCTTRTNSRHRGDRTSLAEARLGSTR